MSLDHYIDAFSKLRMNRSGGGGGGGSSLSPHKVCILLAVMDLVEQGAIATNRIYLNSDLKAAFTQHFEKLRGERDQNTPHYPFYHLVTSAFWHHQVRTGKETEYQTLKTASSENQILAIIEYAYADDELFEYFRSPSACEALRAALFNNFDDNARKRILQPRNAWTWGECELIVQDYFSMLTAELNNQKYNKSEHNQALQQQINRPKGSIERKHQNISAILKEMGLPVIDGYKPLPNYQRKILPDVVGAQWAQQTSLQQLVTQMGDKIGKSKVRGNILDCQVLTPELKPTKPATKSASNKQYRPVKLDYVAREARNRKLGINGEQFIIEFEKTRLTEANKGYLADQIDHVSQTDDAAGFDIHSYETNGQDRFIEVKTTNYARYTPFYVSTNEVNTAKRLSRHYQWYRLFAFSQDPRFFVLNGDIEQHCRLEAAMYRALMSE